MLDHFEFMHAVGCAAEVAENAESKYGEYASPHEVLGVICEEWNELQDAMHKSDYKHARQEAIDIAAVCLRFASETTRRERAGQC